MFNFKPMLACSTIPKITEIKYPVLASPKLDGIRCLIINGVPVSRSLKPIPNDHIRNTLIDLALPNLDGELMLISGDFNDVQSAVMSKEGEPDFEYVVFDVLIHPDRMYGSRLADEFVSWIEYCPYIRLIKNEFVKSSLQMERLYKFWLDEGYEGAIVRDPRAPYKCGRSTLKQGWMLKLKNFSDAEAEIVGYEELMHNDNEATIDKLGHTVRSSHKENQTAGGMLGALIVKYNGVQFKIGTGFDIKERLRLWSICNKLGGQLVTFKFQELSKYGVPRFPVYKGLRNKADT